MFVPGIVSVACPNAAHEICPKYIQFCFVFSSSDKSGFSDRRNGGTQYAECATTQHRDEIIPITSDQRLGV